MFYPVQISDLIYFSSCEVTASKVLGGPSHINLEFSDTSVTEEGQVRFRSVLAEGE